jgi:hypothetical protein
MTLRTKIEEVITNDNAAYIKLGGKSKDVWAIVDSEDLELVSDYSWSSHHGYARTAVVKNGKRTTMAMHRLILGHPDSFIDHINGNRSDNRKSNLRLASNKQNCHNRGTNRNNTSGYKGVYWSKQDQRWQAKIIIDRNQIYLGSSKDKTEAAKMFNEAAKKYHGEFAFLNPVQG